MRPRPWRVIVLDDRSTDDTAALARRHRADVIAVPAEGGLGRARNLGLSLGGPGLVAFLNADCLPRVGWLAVLTSRLGSTGAAVAGGKQVELRKETWAERWKAIHLRQDLGDLPLLNPDFLSGGNLLIDTGQLGDVQFDVSFRTAYEDVAFCRALRSQGSLLLYEPGAIVDHDHSETLRTLPLKVWSYGINSRRVGPVSCLRAVPQAFLRMHRRPHDQVRVALIDDLRQVRIWSLLIDLYLLAASFRLFVNHARRQSAIAREAV
jgi:GT2 family glycosyltransferase